MELSKIREQIVSAAKLAAQLTKGHWTQQIFQRIFNIALSAPVISLGNSIDYYYITGLFGMHPQDTILERGIPLKSPVESTLFLIKIPQKKDLFIECALVLDKIADGLFVNTVWLFFKNDCVAAPALSFLSPGHALSDCNEEQIKTLLPLIGKNIKYVLESKKLYGLFPLFPLSGNAQKDAEDLDWTDSGTDLILRYLLIMGIKSNVELRSSPFGFQEVYVDGNKIGMSPATETALDETFSASIDILPNILGFTEEIEKYL
jgi:hypothetical protein